MVNGFLNDLAKKVEQEANKPPSEQRYNEAGYNRKNLIVNKFLRVYFDGKNLQDITDQDVINYVHWRKNYWISGEGANQEYVEFIRDGRKVRRPKNAREQQEPSWGTINKALTILRQIYEFARQSNIIKGREVPVIKNVSKPRNLKAKKASVDEQEVKPLLETLADRYQRQKDINPKHARSHKLALY